LRVNKPSPPHYGRPKSVWCSGMRHLPPARFTLLHLCELCAFSVCLITFCLYL
jgi:hypothetical protein